MNPDELSRLLGPYHNVPWDRLVTICEAFNQEARGIAEKMIRKHEAECHAHQAFKRMEPELGTREWARLRAN